MKRVFDRIVVAVPDMEAALVEYTEFLGSPGEVSGSPGSRTVVRWFLSNTVIELSEQKAQTPRLQGIVFNVPGAGSREEPVPNALEFDIRQCDGQSTEAARERLPEVGDRDMSVDHVVLRTGDAQACIDLFAGRLGIRLALDKTVPEWGGRMLFFRGGKLTLEVIQSEEGEPGKSDFWGIAYRCADIEATVEDMQGRGVALSAIREGRKPGTRVATVKSHCLGIPTLLIQPAPT